MTEADTTYRGFHALAGMEEAAKDALWGSWDMERQLPAGEVHTLGLYVDTAGPIGERTYPAAGLSTVPGVHVAEYHGPTDEVRFQNW